MSSSSLDENSCSLYIGPVKTGGVLDAPIHMGFGCKVDHGPDGALKRFCGFEISVMMEDRMLSTEQSFNKRRIADISFNKEVTFPTFPLLDIAQVFEIPRVGELVQVDYLPGRAFFQNKANKIGADKTGSSGNEKDHAKSLTERDY